MNKGGATLALLLTAVSLPARPAEALSPRQLLEKHRLAVSSAAFVSPSTGTLASFQGEIAEVRVHRVNVFDPTIPGEDWWPFLLGDRIHILSRDHVVRRELIQGPGEDFDALSALESERNLRASGFIKRAEIRPALRPGGKLDLDVYSQDSWTLAPQASIGTEGGDKFFIFGIEENNLAGYGKSISAFHSQVGPTISNELRYGDPRLLGSRYSMVDFYGTTSRGDKIGAALDRPFFSLDTPYAVNALWTRIIQEDSLFQDAETRSKFIQNFRAVQASIAAHINQASDPVQRVSLGMFSERDRFTPTADTAAGTLPSDRELNGPLAGYSLIQPRFIKETYIDKMERVEDFNLGNELSVSVGSMLRTLGSDRDRWTLSALEQQGLGLGEGRFVLGQVGVRGRLAGGRPEQAILYANLNVFWKTVLAVPQTFVSHLEANTTRNLDGEDQLVLGGDTGLRGYKNKSFAGTRSVLLNFEDRFFLTREFYHLFYLGGAAFFETGAITTPGAPITGGTFKSDVGLGLRVGPTRSTSGSVLRVDVAYALNSGPGPSRWVVSIRGGQAFQIFNSTNKNVLSTPASVVQETDAGARLRRR